MERSSIDERPTISGGVKSGSLSWAGLCWGAALTLAVGGMVAALRHPDPGLLLPIKSPDVLLYTVCIQKAAAGFDHGDPLLWEHRDSPSSLFSFYHLWPSLYGHIYRAGGHLLLHATALLLSGLWLYAVFLFYLRLGVSRPWAFFAAGIQTFYSGFAYQAAGFKTNFAAYSFWITEHSRLYPTVTSMAVYNLAALSVVWTLERPKLFRALLASALIALAAYGRPFDWMVLLGALGLLNLFAWTRRHLQIHHAAGLLLTLSVIFSSKFVFDHFSYQHSHHADYIDQIARGSLQIKGPGHYVKYTLFCALMLGAMTFAFRRPLAALWKKTSELRGTSASLPLLWLCALATSSLLVHFKTALDGGVTIVGFTYLFVFSMVPWFLMLAAVFLWQQGAQSSPRLFESRIWVAALFALLLVQHVGIGLSLVPSRPTAALERGRREVYQRISSQGSDQPVILTAGNGLEAVALTDGWLFFTHPHAATYACAASTRELLDRFLLAKLLLTGTLHDLAPLFTENGIPHFRTWLASQDPATRAWIALLEPAIGANTFIFHPQKNRGELEFRKIRLPESLAAENDFVCFFPTELRRVFQGLESRLDSKPCATVLETILESYRLNYIYLPPDRLAPVDAERLTPSGRLREIVLPPSAVGRLWEVKTGHP